jgi:hypothetical protein
MGKPSSTQLKVLQRMVATNGIVYRISGGFWISGEFKNDRPVLDSWCDIRTIRAMEHRGWVCRTNAFPEEWRDNRKITPEGIREVHDGRYR